MFKVIFIGALLAVLIFFIIRRLGFIGGRPQTYLQTSEWLELRLDNATLKKVVKQTLFSVGIGFVLLILVLVIAAKFKIALILIPISLYLIGQYFILINHINATKKYQIFFHRNSNAIKVRSKGEEYMNFSLHDEAWSLKEVKAVQKNNGLLIGYYELRLGRSKVYISSLLEENVQNKAFFEKLRQFPREIESKLFPVI